MVLIMYGLFTKTVQKETYTLILMPFPIKQILRLPHRAHGTALGKVFAGAAVEFL